MKTAFIRVSSKNETKEKGIVTYTFAQINDILVEWSKSANITYWFIEHTADEEVSLTHWHIVIKFKSPYPFEQVKSKFPYGDIESAKNIKKAIQYLVHFNDKSKVQYSWDNIHTNCDDMTPYKVTSISQDEVSLQTILDDIEKGSIREYNQFDKIPIEIWSKYRTRIDNALTYKREKIVMDKDRQILVVFVSGASGKGKTTFAKTYCKMNKKSFCISSSSNDVMQDYKGEDVLILDDMRDDSFTYTDLLKVLDNHTRSTVKSRYHNKAFIGDTIIITSYKPLNDWYFNVDADAKKQLYRRIPIMFKMYDNKIEQYHYSNDNMRYEFDYSVPNTFNLKPKQVVDMGKDMLKSMGFDMSVQFEQKLDEFMEVPEDFDLFELGGDK